MDEQRPDLFIVSSNHAMDLGIVHPRSMISYFDEKMKLYGNRTLPIIIGTDGTIHPKSKQYLQDLGVDIPKFMTYANFVIEYQPHKASLTICRGSTVPSSEDG